MTVGIVGLGLIGGSIGLALRDPSRTILGFDASAQSAGLATQRFCVDQIVALEEVAKADIVFVAVPPSATINVLEQVFAAKGASTVVTDCASVKSEIVKWAETSGHRDFVPGHPMAGHEKGSALYASAWMFRNARWILTPTEKTAKSCVRAVEAVVKEMGAVPVRLNSESHDRQVAILSHLPHAVAATLVLLSENLDRADVSAGSWRDATRVGGVDPHLWTQIFLGNRTELARGIRDAQDILDQFRNALESGDSDAVFRLFAHAQEVKAKQEV